MSNAIDCTNNQLTEEQIIAALMTKNASGEFGFRVTFIDACDDDAIDCSNNSLTPEAGFKASLGVSECGKIALRLALPKGSFLNNVESFADDAAAAAGGYGVGDIYFNTTTSKLHTRMA